MRVRTYTFKADEKLMREVDRYAWKMRMTRSEVIRKAVEHYIHEHAQPKMNVVVRRHVLK